jgi:hypothetical protein
MDCISSLRLEFLVGMQLLVGGLIFFGGGSGLLDMQLKSSMASRSCARAAQLCSELDARIANGCRSWSSSRALADIAEGTTQTLFRGFRRSAR